MDSSTPVIYKGRLLKTIQRNKEVIITHAQLEKINSIIIKHLQTGASVKKEHRKQTKKTVKRKKQDLNIEICPKCGGKLEVKHRKYGWFHGCSNFPRCKFTRNIK
ncbi:MAG: hypothetical protein CMH48_08910 [Muricauda sp.]|nr:hypothetical protein [Allomuricauda sp.]